VIVNIDVLEAFTGQVPVSLLEAAALAALQYGNAPEHGEITILVEADDDLRELNSQFRDVDAPTDVLAFSAEEIDPETGNLYLGDIAIAFPYASEQAAAAGHPVTDELQLLVVHGVLHLLGLDHIEPDDTVTMWNAQYEIMDGLGINIRSWPLISGPH